MKIKPENGVNNKDNNVGEITNAPGELLSASIHPVTSTGTGTKISGAYPCMRLPNHSQNFTYDQLGYVDTEQNDSGLVGMWDYVNAVIDKSANLYEALSDFWPEKDNPYSSDELAGMNALPTQIKEQFVFNPQFFQKIAALARQLPVHFPQGEIPRLTAGVASHITFSRSQAASIVAHMMLCTLTNQKTGPKQQHWNDWWANFGPWFHRHTQPTETYMTALFHYINEINDSPPYMLSAPIQFTRLVHNPLNDWHTDHSLFKVVEMLQQDPQLVALEERGVVELSFANKDVGFGISGTQEERLMGLSPELCLAMLLSPRLADNEGLLIEGAMPAGICSGFGRGVEWVGYLPDTKIRTDWQQRAVLVLDALELDEDQIDKENVDDATSTVPFPDLHPKAMDRELNKLFCGLSAISGRKLLTGHWGCGAFGGHREVKALLQMIAAARANVQLAFYEVPEAGAADPPVATFSQQLPEFSENLQRHGISNGVLYQSLRDLRTTDFKLQNSVFNVLSQRLFPEEK
jgi:Poly (ADP-ribose) glycohydrolase (PARG)